MAPPGGSQTGNPKARAWSSGWSRQVDDPAGLPALREAEVCESTGHKNAQPTRPERNAQAADFHLPSKDDPQQMYYRHHEEQRGGDHHIGFSVQSACPSASRPTTPDSSLRLITGDPNAVGRVSHPLSTLSTDNPVCLFASELCGRHSGRRERPVARLPGRLPALFARRIQMATR
jgi:hypothetical protein